jgi:hypothetical protein
MRACRNTPSAHTYRYRRADKSRFCQCPYSRCHSAVRREITADGAIAFRWKDYRVNGPGRWKTVRLHPHEFIRRFLIHVLPKGFHRIRHYGLLANTNRAENIARARELLGLATPAAEEAVGIDPAAVQPLAQPCPCCGGRMFVIETFEPGCQRRYQPTATGFDTS